MILGRTDWGRSEWDEVNVGRNEWDEVNGTKRGTK
jgi:hypothetical protein